MIRVLIVEDDPLIAAAHREYLDRIGGFEVVDAVATAQLGLRRASEAAAAGNPVGLVLLDLGLPDARGVDLAAALSGVRPEPDIIAITAQRDLASVRSAMAHGVLLYLLKPFTFAGFQEKIGQYLRYRDALGAGGDAVSQRDVDRALAVLRTADDRSTARKGAAPATEDAVGRAVRDSEAGLTASEVAAAVGSSRVTAWRYLERLGDDGTVERVTEYGTTGRPQIRYRWRR
ncbi:response regulator [Gordonia amarae]|uniref:Transcriptional regulatory protein n=2 Tax=Gordonia amarae TaxID=36821 RepID=G7GMX6_9ACTN|nr:response regulator [Gordonia amarae]MCS3878577.1 response regulator of citrate/malate metabolism [Gordonia amarae]QHN17176.1 response regulator [Gordonia amarae]QHN21702.1 response regulator [Gordonia amarae]QHN30554.1 response regulator [Gordonia amarae]QHN39330.1 response regulator [Gordonia amarae]